MIHVIIIAVVSSNLRVKEYRSLSFYFFTPFFRSQFINKDESQLVDFFLPESKLSAFTVHTVIEQYWHHVLCEYVIIHIQTYEINNLYRSK